MRIALVIVAALLLVGVAWYLALVPARTFITFSSADGRSVTFSRGGVRLRPPPEQYPTGGFTYVASYLSRLQHSRKQKASVIMATRDGLHALLVVRYAKQNVLSVSVNRIPANGEEARMLQFFSNLGMSPIRDYLSDNGGVKNATRTCRYNLPDDPQANAQLCISVFTNLFGVGDEQGLKFRTDGLPSADGDR